MCDRNITNTSCACKQWVCRICGSDTGERKAKDLHGMEMGILAELGVRRVDAAGGSNGLRWRGEPRSWPPQRAESRLAVDRDSQEYFLRKVWVDSGYTGEAFSQ